MITLVYYVMLYYVSVFHNLPFSSTSLCFTFCLINAGFVCCVHLYCNCFFQVFFLIENFTFEELKVQVLQEPSNLKDAMMVILFRGKNRDAAYVLVVVTTT